jgi:RsiW-degrading membrane proteinase PrsW (M82 family)
VPGIYVMAIITLAASVALWGGLVHRLSGRQGRYLWLLLPGLPLSAIANLGIKGPLARLVAGAAGITPTSDQRLPVWFLAFLFLLAPLFEEALKALPLVVPGIRAMARYRSAAFWSGIALGISFGLGEAAYIAYGVAQSTQYAHYPWYAFIGFFLERTLTCLAHGVFTAVMLMGLQRKRSRAWIGYLLAVGLHALLNVGAALLQFQILAPEWAQLYTFAAFIAVILLFISLRVMVTREGVPPG